MNKHLDSFAKKESKQLKYYRCHREQRKNYGRERYYLNREQIFVYKIPFECQECLMLFSKKK